ncbi:MAG TPA: hypothetical protein VHI52_18830 [Verrucomicrobiae bacterium]|nr:hypothetical protein [Verrucomicrobiae bacterium]HWB08269.1 hypothetical protein [Pirellulales bacterium]
MAKTKIQFSTKALLGIVSYIAVALACLRTLFEPVGLPPLDIVRVVAAVCIGCGCCFGISGIVVGWPIRGFIFGLLVGAAFIFVFFMSALPGWMP